MTTEFKLAIKLEYDGKAVTSGLDASRTGVVNFRQAAVAAADSIAVSFKNVQTSGTAVGATFNQVAAQITQNTAAISANTAAIKQQAAAQLEASRAAAAAAAARLAATKTAAADLGNLEKSTAAVGMSARATAAALRQVPAQVTDIVVGLQAGQSPLTVLLQQGGQLKDVFGGVGPAVRALGGYLLSLVNIYSLVAVAVGGVALAHIAGQKEAEAYNQAIILSGNAAGTTSGQLNMYAQRIASVIGTQGTAAEAVTAFAESGRVASGNLELAGRAAVSFERATGQAIGDTVKQFEELAKSPLEASVKLNERYNYLTASVYEQIKALQEQGKTTEAANLAQNTFAETIESRSGKIVENVGYIEAAWRGVKDAISGAIDFAKSIGREATPQDQIATLQKQIEARQQRNATLGIADGAETQKLQVQLAVLQGIVFAQDANAKAIAQSAAATRLKAAFDKDGEKFETNKVKLQKELIAETKRGQELIAAGRLEQAQLDDRLAAIRKKYPDTEGASALENALSAELALYKGYADDRTAILAGAEKSAESLRKQGLLDERQLADALFRIRDDALVDQIALAELSAATAGGKKQKAEQQRFIGEVAKLNTQRENNQRAHNDRLAEIDAEQAKRIRDKVTDWEMEGEAAKKALAIEYALYGATAEARAVALAGLKLETEAEKLIADAKRAGIPFSEAQAEAIRAEAAARGKNVSAMAGEAQALAGAQQLRDANRRFAAENILDEDARARAVLEIDADVWRQRIALAGEGTEAQKRLAAEFSVYYQNQLDKPMTDRWKATVERFDSTFRQGFTRLLEGGKDKWSAFNKSILNAFKTEVADQIYRTFLKPFVVKVIGSFLGVDASSAGVPGAEGGGIGGGLPGITNLVSTVNNGIKLVNLGFEGLGVAVRNGVGSFATSASQYLIDAGFENAATYVANSFNASSSGIAAGAAGIGAALVGAIAGNIISGGYSAIGKNPNTAIGIGAAIGSIVPGIGTAIGAAIGAVIGGIVNRVFGRKLTETGIKGTFDASGFSGVNYTYEKGGLFRSDREREQGPVDNETVNLLNQAYSAVKNSVAGMAQQLGVGREAIDAFTTDVRLNFKGLDEEGITKMLGDTLSGIGDQLADAVLAQTAGLKELAIRGETSVQTLGRLAEFITTVNGVVDFLNIGLFDLSVTGVKAAQSFVDLFGGLENFGRVTGVYYENFFSATEKQAIKLQRVAGSLNQLNMAGAFVDTAVEFQRLVVDPTRDNYRALVQAQNVNTEAGRNTSVALLGLAGAVAEVLPASEAATVSLQSLADKFLGVADRLLDGAALQAARVARIQATLAAGGVNLTADQVRNLTRSQVLTGYEQALALGANGAADAILSVVDSLAELNPVAFAAASAVTAQGDAMNILAQRREIEIEIMRLSGNEVGALARERQVELAALDPSLRAIKAQAYALRDAKAAQEAYTEAVTDAQRKLDEALSARETAQGKVDQATAAVQAVRDRGTAAYISAQQQLATAQQRVLDLTRQSAEAYSNSANSLRGYLRELAGSDAGSSTGPEQLAARRNEFNATYQAALGGDKAAYDAIQTVAANFLQASRDNNAVEAAFRADDVQVRMALARLADMAATRAAAGGATSSVDPAVQAQLDLTAATTALAKAHADATAIGASLVAQQDNLVVEFAEAQAALAIANAQLAAAGTQVSALQAVLNAIQLNTAATATNIAGLPDAIAAIRAQANLEVGALIRFIADSTGLPADLRELATSTARTIGRTIDFVGNATGLPTDLRTLALATSSGFTKTVNYLVGSVLTEDLKRIALTQTDTLTKTVSAVLDSTTPAALQSLILNQAGIYQATVSAVAASGLDPALQRVLFTGTGDYVTRITSVIDSALSAEQRALLLSANTTALRSVTLSATLGAALSADQQKILNQANETVSKVLTASVASGYLSDEQVRLLHQANESVSKVVQASVSSTTLTADQSAILRAVTGTAVGTVNVSANVAFNSNDPLQSIFSAISANTAQAVQIATIQTQQLAQRLDLIAGYTGSVDARSQGGGLVVRTATQAGPLQYFAKGGLVNSPTLFSDNGVPSMAGEAGEEWILPAVRMPNGDMGVQALAPDYGRSRAPDGGMRAVVEELRAIRQENRQLRDEVAGLRADQQRIGVRTIESAGKTADTLRKWDIAGQPPARAVPAEA